MGRRSRARGRIGKLVTPTSTYRDGEGSVLTLRAAMTPKTRAEYADALHGSPLSQEDAWHRSVEFLFERLAVTWEISGVATEGQKQLLQRLRAASQDERSWVREVLREHLAEHFPEMEAP